MFGYIRPDDPYLYKKDDVLYKSAYCGVCKAIGSTCGQAARFALTFDVAFLSTISHNITNNDLSIERERCVAHPFKKRPMAKVDALTQKLAYVNTLLAYYKLYDDVRDNGKGKFKRGLLKRGYKKAKRACPEIDAIVRNRYAELIGLEVSGADSVDRVSDPFSVMLAEISREVLGEYATENTSKLFYSVGKFVYLIDALDDYDKDVKKGNYNVFYACYKRESAKRLVEECGEEINFIFSSLFADLEESFNGIRFYFNRDLIKNVLLAGVKKTFAEVRKRMIDER